jgi:hypothetical protein
MPRGGKIRYTTFICAINDCREERTKSIWCNSHYRRFKKYGHPEGKTDRLTNVGCCLIDGCDKPQEKKHMCAMHYQRQRLTGSTDGLRIVRNGAPPRWRTKREERITTKDILWMSGLLEGEGCFQAGGNRKGIPYISVGMTDRDVVEHAGRLLGAPKVGVASHEQYPHLIAAHHKPNYRVVVAGVTAAAWMMTVYQFMGERRKAKIREVLAAWRTAPTHNLEKRNATECAHTDDTAYCKGMCRRCYQKQYDASRRDKVAQRGKARASQCG